MLAVTYVLRLDELARDMQAEAVAHVLAAAMGASVGARPDWDAVVAEFDAELAAPPEGRDPARNTDTSMRGIKLRALGVA